MLFGNLYMSWRPPAFPINNHPVCSLHFMNEVVVVSQTQHRHTEAWPVSRCIACPFVLRTTFLYMGLWSPSIDQMWHGVQYYCLGLSWRLGTWPYLWTNLFGVVWSTNTSCKSDTEVTIFNFGNVAPDYDPWPSDEASILSLVSSSSLSSAPSHCISSACPPPTMNDPFLTPSSSLQHFSTGGSFLQYAVHPPGQSSFHTLWCLLDDNSPPFQVFPAVSFNVDLLKEAIKERKLLHKLDGPSLQLWKVSLYLWGLHCQYTSSWFCLASLLSQSLWNQRIRSCSVLQLEVIWWHLQQGWLLHRKCQHSFRKILLKTMSTF